MGGILTLCDHPHCINPKPAGPGRRYCDSCKELTTRKPKPLCSIPDCLRDLQSRGWCHTHYEHNRKWGTPFARSLSDRFYEKVDRNEHEPCWQWLGTGTKTGYGQVSVDGQHRYAHRVSYELHVGPIPDGLQIDHLCQNKWCVNPDHLEPVTPLENTQRAFRARTVTT